MNAIELFDSEGKPVNFWLCGKCNKFHIMLEYAEKCCTPKLCVDCGKEISRYFVRCEECQENYCLENGEQVDTYEYVYIGDRYFQDVEELIEDCLDNDLEIPDRVWVADTSHGFAHTTPQSAMDSVIENITEDMFEDSDTYIAGNKELLEAMETFFKANEKIVSLYPSRKKYYVLSPEMIEKIKKEYNERGY